MLVVPTDKALHTVLDPSPLITRRTLLKAGVAGGVALFLARWLYTQSSAPWPEASFASVTAFLTRWRDSRFALLQSAYGALHQLVMAAWYGSPNAWPAIGYAGPPLLEVS